MVEAGTGVGKSMAYLVPAALTARKNNIAVGIATKTNALLDQLVYHELPALGTALAEAGITGGNAPCDNADSPGEGAEGLTYAALKGFSISVPGRSTLGRIRMSEGPGLALLSYIEQTGMDALQSPAPRFAITTTSLTACAVAAPLLPARSSRRHLRSLRCSRTSSRPSTTTWTA